MCDLLLFNMCGVRYSCSSYVYIETKCIDIHIGNDAKLYAAVSRLIVLMLNLSKVSQHICEVNG